MNVVAEKDNTLVKWLEKNQMKVEMVESLQSLNIITLNDLKNADPSLLEERVISQLRQVPAKKLRESLASLRETPALPPKDDLSSPAVGAIFSEASLLPVSIEEKKESFLSFSEHELKPVSMISRTLFFGVQKAVDDLNSLTIEELQKELEKEKNKVEELLQIQHFLPSKNPPDIPTAAAPAPAPSRFSLLAPSSTLAGEKKEETTLPRWKCSMCKRENKAEDEKCLDCFTAKSNPPAISPRSMTIIRYRCRNCRSIKRFRFRAPCEKCKTFDCEPVHEGDTENRSLRLFNP
eukprot:gene13218-14509_t